MTVPPTVTPMRLPPRTVAVPVRAWMQARTLHPAAREPWRPVPAGTERPAPGPAYRPLLRRAQMWRWQMQPAQACPVRTPERPEPAMRRMTTRPGMRVGPFPPHQVRVAWARHSHHRRRARTESWRQPVAQRATARAVASQALLPGPESRTGWMRRTGSGGRQAREAASAPPLLLSLPCGPAGMSQGRTRQGEQQWGPSSYWSVYPVGVLPATGRESLMTRARPTQRQRKPPPDATGPNRP